MTLKPPYEKLAQSACAEIRAELEWLPEEIPGDSPIEKALLVALHAFIRWGGTEYTELLIANDAAHSERLREQREGIIVERQVQLAGWRVDFVVYAYNLRPKLGPDGWRRLIVECDGHDYHERTKEQAARDRLRDREAQMQGIPVFRFTGSQIHRDPWACAREVVEWALQGY